MRIKFALIAGALFFPLAAAANPALEQLSGMANALQVANYDGVYVHQRGADLQASRVVHTRSESGLRERIVRLTGEEEEIHRHGDKVTCYYPEKRSVFVDQNAAKNPFSVAANWDLGKISSSYHVLAGNELQRVAGRACRAVALKPRDKSRYGYHLCIDQETDMLLQADLVSRGGRVLEHIMFTHITFPEKIPESAFDTAMDFDGVNWTHNPTVKVAAPVTDYRRESGASGWSLTQLPLGFDKSSEKLSDSRRRQPVRHMVYSDGLATVSVFIEAIQDRAPLEGLSAMGIINAYGRVVNGHQITVVGDVPKSTVRAMAMSVSYDTP